jgi:hypothetical protein
MDGEEQKRGWKWFKCPECEIIWSWATDSGEESDNVSYSTLPPKNVEISEEKSCPLHEEIILYGRRKGGVKEVDLKKTDLNNGIRCPVCGSKDLDIDPEIDIPDLYGYICQLCNSHLMISWYPNSVCIARASYREDLQTKEFNEAFNEYVEILKTEGTPIR